MRRSVDVKAHFEADTKRYGLRLRSNTVAGKVMVPSCPENLRFERFFLRKSRFTV